ncbi:hypothetical protein HGM15179_013426 [Zosterops borbonicus]|uniref:Uncharacterized protein n=1 Tax=Zosterops borbonicus TaxID=364589 RepID=A0A8K1LH99_9PASS|nr:hypothetical protein HGM15179_013426 [Zosterops borbonicus]
MLRPGGGAKIPTWIESGIWDSTSSPSPLDSQRTRATRPFYRITASGRPAHPDCFHHPAQVSCSSEWEPNEYRFGSRSAIPKPSEYVYWFHINQYFYCYVDFIYLTLASLQGQSAKSAAGIITLSEPADRSKIPSYTVHHVKSFQLECKLNHIVMKYQKTDLIWRLLAPGSAIMHNLLPASTNETAVEQIFKADKEQEETVDLVEFEDCSYR